MQIVGEGVFTSGKWKTIPGGCSIETRPCVVNVELKEIDDFWQSKGSGHLGQQLVSLIAQGEPGFVAVFGSLADVLEAVPRVATGGGKPMQRGQMAIDQDLNTCRAFCGDAIACGVPVHFLSTDREQSFRYILSYAKHILRGANLSSWLPKRSAAPDGYEILCAIHGIGDAVAKNLLQQYETVDCIVDDCKFAPDALADTKIHGKKLGRAKAGLIVKAFTGRKPEAWA